MEFEEEVKVMSDQEITRRIVKYKFELPKLEEEWKKREKIKFMKNSIIVYCPQCKGSGKIIERDWQSGWEIHNERYAYEGKGIVRALKY